MESFGYLCLMCYLCPISLMIGTVVFVLTKFVSGKIITKRFEKNHLLISTLIAIFLSVIVAFVFFNSQFAPAFPGYYHPAKKPKHEDIIGVWTATEPSLDYLNELGYIHSNPTLSLESSGSFTTTDFPDTLFFHRNNILYSGEGTWRLVRGHLGYWQVELIFDFIDPPWYPDPPLSGPTPCPSLSVPCEGLEFTFDMWNREPPYYIFKYIWGELGPNIYYHRLGDTHDVP